jgi:hypothetical protein
MVLDLKLTGASEPVPYYVMYDRWEYVSDWVLLVLAPLEGVDNAISVKFSSDQVELEAGAGEEVRSSLTLANTGTLDVRIVPSAWPSWLEFEGDAARLVGSPIVLARGSSIEVEFVLKSSILCASISTVAFRVEDDGYADCFYDRDVTFDAVLKVKSAVDKNLIGSTVIAGLVLMSVVMATALGFVIWTIHNRNERIVRCSQPNFLVMLSVGTIIMASAILTLGIDDGNSSSEAADRACMATPWLLNMGFVISFSALFSKIWRINKIFLNPQFRRIIVTEADVLVPFAVLFALNFALLLAWTLYDPLRFERLPVGSTNAFNTYGTCKFEHDGTIGIAVGILAVRFGAIILACAQAYRARQISDEFSESRWVGVTVASWLQVFVVGFPVMFLVKENPTAAYFLRSSIIFVTCMSLLLFIFVPKILIHRHHSKNDGNEHKSISGFRPSYNDEKTPNKTSEYGIGEGSSQGIGIRIVSSPGVLSSQIGTEDGLLAQIKELQDRNREMEHLNSLLQAVAINNKKAGQSQRLLSTESSLPTYTAAESGTAVEPSSQLKAAFVDSEASTVEA